MQRHRYISAGFEPDLIERGGTFGGRFLFAGLDLERAGLGFNGHAAACPGMLEHVEPEGHPGAILLVDGTSSTPSLVSADLSTPRIASERWLVSDVIGVRSSMNSHVPAGTW